MIDKTSMSDKYTHYSRSSENLVLFNRFVTLRVVAAKAPPSPNIQNSAPPSRSRRSGNCHSTLRDRLGYMDR
jgi:hypothetical protein